MMKRLLNLIDNLMNEVDKTAEPKSIYTEFLIALLAEDTLIIENFEFKSKRLAGEFKGLFKGSHTLRQPSVRKGTGCFAHIRPEGARLLLLCRQCLLPRLKKSAMLFRIISKKKTR